MSGPAPTTRHTARGRVLATLAALGFAGALALAPASAASAHDYLVDSTPAAGSTVTEPLHTVSLTFDDIVLDLSGNGSSSIVQVTGPDAGTRHFETGCATTEGRVVTAPVALGGPGTYTVAWQIVSADGHTVSQKMQFSYKPPAGNGRGRGQRPAARLRGGRIRNLEGHECAGIGNDGEQRQSRDRRRYRGRDRRPCRNCGRDRAGDRTSSASGCRGVASR